MASFVGRQRELDAVRRVMTGHGGMRTAVVTGEAGIGKSRLISEAGDSTSEHGASVLVGRCLPLAHTVPLLPVTEALRAQGPPPADLTVAVRALPERSTTALAALAPELVPAGAAHHADGPADATGADAATAAGAVVDDPSAVLIALRDVLTAAHQVRRLVLVVEDLHWADALTLDLLTLLMHAPAGPPVVVSLRDDEPSRAEHLDDWLAATLRHETALLVTLAPLTSDEVDELTEELAGGTVLAPLRGAVRDRAGGNPLFAEQLVYDALATPTTQLRGGACPTGSRPCSTAAFTRRPQQNATCWSLSP